jgi:hypothetical protein
VAALDDQAGLVLALVELGAALARQDFVDVDVLSHPLLSLSPDTRSGIDLIVLPSPGGKTTTADSAKKAIFVSKLDSASIWATLNSIV